ncbi:transcriptional regulator, GntR family [Geodermatophilus sabuli]|uniref:Transcriptional regulator, GntR family n=2 Tax=Geodermatophilus sabuli TaxID=1564158 RepID=A0A285EDS1_9ACTN|nr:transcriptional regulator, GntR family [Geodermatophilus sabuli]
MAAVLGVSRVPLREALRVLASEGLLTHRLNQGYFVAELSIDEFRQIVALLEYLETELIRTARWPSPEEVDHLRELNARLSAATSDLSSASELNREFHFAVFRLSPKKVFVSEAERYWNLAEPFRMVHVATADREEIVTQHEDLVDALAAQDRVLTIRVMNDHRRDTLASALATLTARPGSHSDRAVS